VSKELKREPTPEPEESEEERLERETQENLSSYVALQSLVRGILVRDRVNDVRFRLRRRETGIVKVQSQIRGAMVRMVFTDHLREYRRTIEWVTQA